MRHSRRHRTAKRRPQKATTTKAAAALSYDGEELRLQLEGAQGRAFFSWNLRLDEHGTFGDDAFLIVSRDMGTQVIVQSMDRGTTWELFVRPHIVPPVGVDTLVAHFTVSARDAGMRALLLSLRLTHT